MLAYNTKGGHACLAVGGVDRASSPDDQDYYVQTLLHLLVSFAMQIELTVVMLGITLTLDVFED